jgi:hypothetical protein
MGNYYLAAFFEELRRLGYFEGANLLVQRYSGEGRTEHYADLARDVVVAVALKCRAIPVEIAKTTSSRPRSRLTAHPRYARLFPAMA